jgi:copper chaperone
MNTSSTSPCPVAAALVLSNVSSKKLDGVKSFDISLDTQTAIVVTEPSVSYDTVLSTIKKTGKKINTGEADGSAMGV